MHPHTSLGAAASALALCALAAGGARADNSTRFAAIQEALGGAAPANSVASGLAGVAFGPLSLQRYDTPANDSFGAEGATLFPLTIDSGLGNPAGPWGIGAPCTMPDGRSYGIMADLGPFWSTVAAAPLYPACGTNTHLAYNDLLRAVRTCGNLCFVDIASLIGIDGVRDRLRGAMEGWAVGKPATARLVLRLTEGYPVAANSSIDGEVDYFSQAVRAGAGRIQVYGVAIGTGAPGLGTWSHVKLFDVYDLSSHTYRALIGGQNHWSDYLLAAPPFDSNTMITGAAATLPSLQLDAAIQWFGENRPALGRAVWWNDRVQVDSFGWTTPGYGNASFGRFSGLSSANPAAAGGLAPGQTALVSLIDMGDFSVGVAGRTIARVLHDLVMNESKDSDIRVFGQSICRAAGFGVDGDCGGRHEQTYMGRLVYRALTSAMMGWRSNVWVISSASSIKNKGYASAYARRVRGSLLETGIAIACANGGYAAGWQQLRFFNNPRGQGSCAAAVTRAINGRFHWRMATAFINGYTARQAVGVHHKIVMFGTEAMYQGSFNGYQSGASGAAFDSKLVENGAIILDPGYVGGQVAAFDEAWGNATPIIGGE